MYTNVHITYFSVSDLFAVLDGGDRPYVLEVAPEVAAVLLAKTVLVAVLRSPTSQPRPDHVSYGTEIVYFDFCEFNEKIASIVFFA